MRRDGTIDFEKADAIWAALTRPRRPSDVPDEATADALMKSRVTRMVGLAGLTQMAYLKAKAENIDVKAMRATIRGKIDLANRIFGAVPARVARKFTPSSTQLRLTGHEGPGR